jgi:hypothetical protein
MCGVVDFSLEEEGAGTFCEATAFIVYAEVPAAAIDLQRSAKYVVLANVSWACC